MRAVAEELELITVEEAAKRFGKAARTIHGWANAHKIRKYQQELTGRVYVNAREIEEKLRIKPRNGDT